jgi:hypothetical protein
MMVRDYLVQCGIALHTIGAPGNHISDADASRLVSSLQLAVDDITAALGVQHDCVTQEITHSGDPDFVAIADAACAIDHLLLQLLLLHGIGESLDDLTAAYHDHVMRRAKLVGLLDDANASGRLASARAILKTTFPMQQLLFRVR